MSNLAERRDTLKRLTELCKSEDIQAFEDHIRLELSNAIDSLCEVIPQTVGDVFEREQLIGNIRSLNNIKRFFQYRLETAKEMVDELETQTPE